MLRRISLLMLPGLLAAILYSYSFQLPFYLDDGIHFRMIRDYDLSSYVPGFRFWGGSNSYGFYRPAVFTLWEWNGMLFGDRYDPRSLHILNVVFFAISAVAVTSIIARITRRESAGFIGGLLFVIFPFQYNAVIWIAGMHHVFMVLGLTLALRFSLLWLDHGRWWGLGLALVCAFLGIFSHESAVTIWPLLALLIALLYGVGAVRQWHVWALMLPLAGIIAVYIYLTLTVPRPGEQPVLRLDEFPNSLAALLQGLIYPVAALIRRITLAEAQTLPLLALATAVIAPFLGLTLWHIRRLGFIAGYGLIWYIVTLLPATLLLEESYVTGSPRLLLLPSIGAAIFWSASLSAIWQPAAEARPLPRWVNRAAWMAAIVLAAGGLMVSAAAYRTRRDHALLLSDYTWALQDVMQAYPPQGEPMLINAPAYLNPLHEDRLFMNLSEGVMFMESYSDYAYQFWAQTGQDFPDTEGMAFFMGLHPVQPVAYAPYQTIVTIEFTERLRESGSIYVTSFEPEGFMPVFVGHPGEAGSDVPIARFPEAGLTLFQADARLIAPRRLEVITRWQIDTPQGVTPQIEVMCGDKPIGGSIMQPWGGAHPFWAWQMGEVQTDRREIRLEEVATADCLTVTVGVMIEAGLIPLEAWQPDGSSTLEGGRVPAVIVN